MDAKKNESEKQPSENLPEAKTESTSKSSDEEEVASTLPVVSSSPMEVDLPAKASSSRESSPKKKSGSAGPSTSSTSPYKCKKRERIAGKSLEEPTPISSSSDEGSAAGPSKPTVSPYKCKKRERLPAVSLEEPAPASSSDEGFHDNKDDDQEDDKE